MGSGSGGHGPLIRAGADFRVGPRDVARMLELAPEGTILADLVSRAVLSANAKFLACTRFRPTDLAALELGQLHDLKDLEKILQAASRANGDDGLVSALCVTGRDGLLFDADVQVRPLAEGGGSLAMIAYTPRGAAGAKPAPQPAGAEALAFTRRLTTVRDREELGRVAIEAAATLAGCETILLVSRAGTMSNAEAMIAAGFAPDAIELVRHHLDGLLNGPLLSADRLHVIDLSKPGLDLPPEIRAALEVAGVGCLTVFPLENDDRVFGAWALGHPGTAQAVSAATPTIRSFAQHLAGALNGVLLLERTRREKSHHEVLNRIISWIGGPFDLDRVLRSLTDELAGALDVDRCLVLLAERPGDEPKELNAEYEFSRPGMTTFRSCGPIAFANTSLAQAVVYSRGAQAVDDLRLRADLTEHHEDLFARVDLRSLILAKIFSRQQFVGIIVVGTSGRPRAWTPEEVDLVRAVADHVSVTLEAGRLAKSKDELFAQIERERREWERTFDAIPDMLSVHDGYGRLLRANLALQLRMGGDPRTFMGHSCMEILERIIGHHGECPHEEAQQTRRPIERQVQGPHGFFSLTAIPCFDQSGTCLYIVHVCKETTQEVQMREQLLQTEKMAAVGNLVSGVAHELNNPLAGVIGFAQILLERMSGPQPAGPAADPARVRKTLERINEEAGRAARIVKNLLTFARKHKPESTMVDVNGVLEKTLELRAYDLRVNKIKVTLSLAPGLPSTHADPNQLQQVFLNIVTNAEQAMREAHGKGELRISTAVESSNIRVRIVDDGPGIKPEHLKQVFDPFFTTKPVGKGTGLGLSICHGIIKEHGGAIQASSTPGQGTEFTIDLPVVVGEMRKQEAKKPAAAPAAPASILVVDDEAAIRDLVHDVLEIRGHRVDAVESGEKAVAALKVHAYDLVVSDLKMPEMDGQELFALIQRDFPDLAKRILFTSGDTVSSETRSFLEKAGRPYLMKPFKVEDLVEEVRKLLQDRPASAGNLDPSSPST